MINKISELFKKYREIIAYLFVGGLTTVVSLGTYYLAVCTVLNPDNALQLQIANIFSWVCAVAFAYFANRKIVFESKNENKLKEATAFVSSRVATLLMDMAIMFLCVTILKWNDKVAKLIVQVVVTIANYILSKIFVFKKS